MERFKIVITDNETGEEILNTDSCCIIGAVKLENGCQSLGLCHANAFNLIKTIVTAEAAIETIKNVDSDKLLDALLHLIAKEAASEPEEEAAEKENGND